MNKSVLEEYISDSENMRAFQQERAIYEVTELIEGAMAESRVTRSQLANLLGRSKGWVTQLLDGQGNKTVRTVADVLAVLSREVHFSAPPIEIIPRPSSVIKIAEGTGKWLWIDEEEPQELWAAQDVPARQHESAG